MGQAPPWFSPSEGQHSGQTIQTSIQTEHSSQTEHARQTPRSLRIIEFAPFILLHHPFFSRAFPILCLDSHLYSFYLQSISVICERSCYGSLHVFSLNGTYLLKRSCLFSRYIHWSASHPFQLSPCVNRFVNCVQYHSKQPSVFSNLRRVQQEIATSSTGLKSIRTNSLTHSESVHSAQNGLYHGKEFSHT